MILRDDQLTAFLPELQASPWVALDTEADSLHWYPEKLCLIQISIPHQDVLVDILAPVQLEPLWAALGKRELILHGADYDLRMMRRHSGFVPAAVFDTMLAARLLGYERFGLGDLVSRHCGVALEKSSQKADWSRRPLTPKLEAYARNDTRYLKPLEAALRAGLQAKGRLEWHQEMCARLIEDCRHEPAQNEDEVWRVKGSHGLTRLGMAVLRDLWFWREQEAISSKRPPFFILSHDAMLAIARMAVAGEDFEPHIPRRMYQPRRERLLDAVHNGLATPEVQQPVALKRHGRRLSHKQRLAFDALQQHRDRHAAALELDPSLIASKATLLSLVTDGETAWQGLMKWQRELLRK